MAKKSPVCPSHKDNPKRAVAKQKRGYGKLAMKAANMEHNEWAQRHDPLFQIKGKERHNKLQERR